jgi:light-harvesting complex 1 beta chain
VHACFAPTQNIARFTPATVQPCTPELVSRASLATWFFAARLVWRTFKMAEKVNPSGLTDDECQEFHKYYIQGYVLWAVGAFVAHSLVWVWRPWF